MDQTKSQKTKTGKPIEQKLTSTGVWGLVILVLVGTNLYAFFELLDRVRLYLWRALAVQSSLTISLNATYILVLIVIFAVLNRLEVLVRSQNQQRRADVLGSMIQMTLIVLGLFLASEVILARLLAGGLI